MAKLVVGGLLALPIAYMILFWVFTKDPLNIAPVLYRTVPGIVPEVLVPEAEIPSNLDLSSEPNTEEDWDDEFDEDSISGNPELGF